MKSLLQNTLFQIAILIIATCLTQSWLFSPSHFFIWDDFTHLNNISQIHNLSFFSLLPKSMYNDRPVGLTVILLLYKMFGLNSAAINASLFVLHLINGVLVFFLVKQFSSLFKLKEKGTISFLTALFFLCWPKSIFAIQWLSAIFDLFGTTLLLLGLNLYLYYRKRPTVILAVIQAALYFLMLRTKEMFLFYPLIVYSVEYFITHSFVIRKNGVDKVFKLILSLLFLLYLFLLFYLGIHGSFEGIRHSNSPYHLIFNPITLLINLFKYLYLFFNVNQGGIGFTSFSKVVTILILLIIVFILYSAYKSANRKLYFFAFCSTILLFLPVLPLSNKQDKLYLYSPSIFLSLLVVLTIYFIFSKIIARSELAVGCMVFILFYANFINKGVQSDRNWWLNATGENKIAYESLSKLTLPNTVEKIIVENVTDENSIFLYGPGNVIRMQTGNQSIETQLMTDSYKGELKLNACLLDYNNGRVLLKQCK